MRRWKRWWLGDGDAIPEACGIYRLVCIETGDSYVGSSLNIRKRALMHLARMCRLTSSYRIKELSEKHGRYSFVVEVIEECEPDNLVALEKHWIRELSPTLNTRKDIHRSGRRRQRQPA